MILLRRSDLGAPRPTGCLTNFCSVDCDVGRSSKPSSSKPSPKWRALRGLVRVLFEAASRAKASAPRSRGLDGLGDLIVDLDTARELGRNSALLVEDSESCRRK